MNDNNTQKSNDDTIQLLEQWGTGDNGNKETSNTDMTTVTWVMAHDALMTTKVQGKQNEGEVTNTEDDGLNNITVDDAWSKAPQQKTNDDNTSQNAIALKNSDRAIDNQIPSIVYHWHGQVQDLGNPVTPLGDLMHQVWDKIIHSKSALLKYHRYQIEDLNNSFRNQTALLRRCNFSPQVLEYHQAILHSHYHKLWIPITEKQSEERKTCVLQEEGTFRIQLEKFKRSHPL